MEILASLPSESMWRLCVLGRNMDLSLLPRCEFCLSLSSCETLDNLYKFSKPQSVSRNMHGDSH